MYHVDYFLLIVPILLLHDVLGTYTISAVRIYQYYFCFYTDYYMAMCYVDYFYY